MNPMPEPAVYEGELQYMPYADSLLRVRKFVKSELPRYGKLIDLMCGPGYLLGQIKRDMPNRDARLRGADIELRYIEYASTKYPEIDFELRDVTLWKPREKFDMVLCTGALHHLPYDKQPDFIKNVASLIEPGGIAIISDCYIDDYSNETERKIAAAKLGHEYLCATIKNGAPDDVVRATADIITNDVMMDEFKTSLKKRAPLFSKSFSTVITEKSWPKFESEYGDYITFLSDPKED